MCDSCDHFVLSLGNQCFRASQAEGKLREFAATIADFNIRGMCQQINHPGYFSTVKFCMDCGHPVEFKPDWGRYYQEAVQAYDCKGSSKLEELKAKEIEWSKRGG